MGEGRNEKKSRICVITWFIRLIVTCKTTWIKLPESDHKGFFLLGQAGHRWSVSMPRVRNKASRI